MNSNENLEKNNKRPFLNSILKICFWMFNSNTFLFELRAVTKLNDFAREFDRFLFNAGYQLF